MLSSAAFNALLKTLEEPPSHAIFILATTEPHKLPRTVASRTQHFPFRLVPRDTLMSHLSDIAGREEIAIRDDALQLLAEVAEGSVRDGISLLDQIASGHSGEITVEDIRLLIGLAHYEQLQQLLRCIIMGQSGEMIAAMDELYAAGVSSRQLLKQLLDEGRLQLRERLHENNDEAARLRNLLESLSAIPPQTQQLDIAIEARLVRVAWGDGPATATSSAETTKDKASEQTDQAEGKHARASKPKNASKRNGRGKGSQHKTQQRGADSEADSPAHAEADSTGGDEPAASSGMQSVWIDALSRVKREHVSLYGLLRNVEVDITDSVCTLTARFQFHYRRLQHPETQAAITAALRAASGRDMELVVENASRTATSSASPAEENQDTSDAADQVLDILGGEIV